MVACRPYTLDVFGVHFVLTHSCRSPPATVRFEVVVALLRPLVPTARVASTDMESWLSSMKGRVFVNSVGAGGRWGCRRNEGLMAHARAASPGHGGFAPA
jgi:hypothetical protein